MLKAAMTAETAVLPKELTYTSKETVGQASRLSETYFQTKEKEYQKGG